MVIVESSFNSLSAFLHPKIQFTTEEMENNSLPFLDTMIKVKEDGAVDISIYRKPTHNDQYLSFYSNHHIKQKLGIISTFQHRIDHLVTNEGNKKEEEEYTKKALEKCGYPRWSLNRKNKTRKRKEENLNPVVTLPYVPSMSEKIAKVFKSHHINTIHKPMNKIKDILYNNKDKVHPMDKTGSRL